MQKIVFYNWKKKLLENRRKDIGEVGSERCHEHDVPVSSHEKLPAGSVTAC